MKRLLVLLLCFVLVPLCAEASEPFAVAAKGAVLIDAETGCVIFGQNENEPLPMASTTKVMTTLLALENADLSDLVTAGPHACGVPGTSMYLSEGETLSMEHMLYGLMLRSGNDAAVAVAEHVAGSVDAFADMMNARAAELDADARFVNPHGLDADGHRISALGLARIMREAMKNPDFRVITSARRKIVPWVGNEYSRVLENKNKLLRTYEGATGGKTGYTGKAGRCLVFSAERDGLSLIGAVLGCPTWFDTAARLLDYGFENFRTERALAEGEIVARIPVLHGMAESLALAAASPLVATLPIGNTVRIILDLPERIEAPVAAGQALGTAILKSGGEIIARCDVVAAATVERRDFTQALKRLLRRWVFHLQR